MSGLSRGGGGGVGVRKDNEEKDLEAQRMAEEVEIEYVEN